MYSKFHQILPERVDKITIPSTKCTKSSTKFYQIKLPQHKLNDTKYSVHKVPKSNLKCTLKCSKNKIKIVPKNSK